MGCDIHMYVEYKSNGPSTTWRCGDYFHTIDPLDTSKTMSRRELYGDRNYDLFAVLANVRNDGHDYMSEPKDLPPDATEYVKQEYGAWGIDAHSCSYFTLKELIEYRDEYKPKDFWDGDVLEPLITKLKQRADELSIIWNFEWKSDFKKACEKANNIRIVFWFDN